MYCANDFVCLTKSSLVLSLFTAISIMTPTRSPQLIKVTPLYFDALYLDSPVRTAGPVRRKTIALHTIRTNHRSWSALDMILARQQPHLTDHGLRYGFVADTPESVHGNGAPILFSPLTLATKVPGIRR